MNFHFFLRKWLIKVNEICSVELLGHRLFAPCNPADYLRFQYGKDWSKPTFSNGVVSLQSIRVWSPQEWLYFVRDYDNYGRLDVKKTLDLLNQWNPQKNSSKIIQLPDES
jgi:hypothetical protein